VFTFLVKPSELKQRLIKVIRFYPVIALVVLGLAYLLGAFTKQAHPIISQDAVITMLYIFIAIGPLFVIVGFILIGLASDRERNRASLATGRLAYEDPFSLPSEQMGGYKVVSITGAKPTLTGLTGDIYKADDTARCTNNPDHIPPVAECECGFYAFKNIKDAKFELSITPGVFLFEVDLFGVGFEYGEGYRAEAQVVRKLITPSRCMRCKTLPVKNFVKRYHLGYFDETWWQWQIRCALCSSTFKDQDRLTVSEMSRELHILIKGR
jgi:hypothetical protein